MIPYDSPKVPYRFPYFNKTLQIPQLAPPPPLGPMLMFFKKKKKTSQKNPGMVGTAVDGMVIEYDEEGHSSSTSAGGEGAVPDGGFKHEYTKRLG